MCAGALSLKFETTALRLYLSVKKLSGYISLCLFVRLHGQLSLEAIIVTTPMLSTLRYEFGVTSCLIDIPTSTAESVNDSPRRNDRNRGIFTKEKIVAR